MKLRHYTESQLKEAIKASTSFAQVLQKLGLVPCGGNYQGLKKAVQHFALDVSHFAGKAWNKGKKNWCETPLAGLSNKCKGNFNLQTQKEIIGRESVHPSMR